MFSKEIIICVLGIIACLSILTGMAIKYDKARDVCLKQYQTDDYEVSGDDTYCRVDGKYLLVAKPS